MELSNGYNSSGKKTLIDIQDDINHSTEPQISILNASKKLISLALPNTATYILQNIADLATLYFIGLLSDSRFTGIIGLGITWYNISAYSVVLGFCSAIDSFIPQCFGKLQFQSCGMHYYRAIVIVFITCFPFAILLCFGGPIFMLLGMDEFVSVSAGEYSKLLVPNLFVHAQYELVRKFLNAQQIATPTTVVTIITTILHPLWCYIFIFCYYDGSYLGAAYAKTITNVLSVVLLIIYIRISGCCSKTLCPINISEIIKDWKPFIYIAIPSALMIVLDWWAYEIMNIMAGIIGSNELSANVALVQLNLLFFMVPVGIGSSACTFVGNSIGAGNEAECKFYIRLGFLINISIIFFFDIALLIFRHATAHYFFQSTEVVNLFTSVVFILVCSELFDTTQGLLSRIMIGMRKQYAATFGVIGAYYGIMIPTGYILLFIFKLGLYGLWYANLLSAFSLALIYGYIIWNADWKKIIEIVRNEDKEEIDN